MSPRRTVPRLVPRWFAAGVVAAVVLGGVFAPASSASSLSATGSTSTSGISSPSPDLEAQFVSRINSLRASKGLSQLKVDSQLLGVARNWTEKMVAAGKISHNPNLSSEVSGNWTKLGENVGVGPSVDALMQAFINSPAHYRNLVDPDWNYVAAAVTRAADGQLYTTHNFMARADSPPPPPPPPTTTPATQPPSPTPTTTPSTGGTTPTTAPSATTTTAPTAPQVPHPNAERVTAVLDPLRSLERG
jgi:uncharacterized protein YkwD